LRCYSGFKKLSPDHDWRGKSRDGLSQLPHFTAAVSAMSDRANAGRLTVLRLRHASQGVAHSPMILST
jgi:hypothetical protein